jgi:hypothetical protein
MFDYGTTISYGQNADYGYHQILSGSENLPVFAPLTGLSPATVYHYRLKAET